MSDLTYRQVGSAGPATQLAHAPGGHVAAAGDGHCAEVVRSPSTATLGIPGPRCPASGNGAAPSRSATLPAAGSPSFSSFWRS